MYEYIMVIFELRYWPVFDGNLFDIFENERWVLLRCQTIHDVVVRGYHTYLHVWRQLWKCALG